MAGLLSRLQIQHPSDLAWIQLRPTPRQTASQKQHCHRHTMRCQQLTIVLVLSINTKLSWDGSAVLFGVLFGAFLSMCAHSTPSIGKIRNQGCNTQPLLLQLLQPLLPLYPLQPLLCNWSFFARLSALASSRGSLASGKGASSEAAGADGRCIGLSLARTAQWSDR